MAQAAFATSILSRLITSAGSNGLRRIASITLIEPPMGSCIATRIRIAAHRIPQLAHSSSTSAQLHLRMEGACALIDGLTIVNRPHDSDFALPRSTVTAVRSIRADLTAALAGSDADKLAAADRAGRDLAALVPARLT